jgi:uncharacterized protein YbaR (Trm112 family)
MTASFKIDPAVLPMLRCPVMQSELTVAESGLVAKANALIAADKLVDRLGQPVPGPLDGALINADQSLLLPTRGGIVVMLEDRLIPMAQLTSDETD